MATFEPVIMQRGAQSATVTTPRDYVQRVFDGWLPIGTPPMLERGHVSVTRDELAGFETDEDVVDFREALREFLADYIAGDTSIPGIAASVAAEIVETALDPKIASTLADEGSAARSTLDAAIAESVGVSFGGLTLSAAAPAVPELSSVNEWAVTDAVQVQLPTVLAGSQHTVHVKSGFHNLTWPNGTTVYGETDQQDVWVTLIRGDAGWNVLIPAPAPDPSAAGVDTGWVHLAGGYNIDTTVWTVDPGAALDSSWGISTGSLASMRARRTGNTFHLFIEGLSKISESTSSETVYTLPSDIDIAIPPSTTFSSLVPTLPSATTFTPLGMARLTYESNTRRVSARAVDGSPLPVGTTLGRTNSPPGVAMISFPIEPSSAWGT